jgi:hypothetical protein
VEIFLIIASIAGQLAKYFLGQDFLLGFVPLFYLDYEDNIPTFFSMLLLLFTALLLVLVTVENVRQSSRYVSRWAVLSLGFMCMAFDEVFSHHERLIVPMRNLLGSNHLGVFYYAWVIPCMVLVFILGIFFLRFVLALPGKTRRNFVIAGIIYLAGAIGFELVSGAYAELHGMHTFTFSMISTVEESLEIAGLITFIWALLEYLADSRTSIGVAFVDRR